LVLNPNFQGGGANAHPPPRADAHVSRLALTIYYSALSQLQDKAFENYTPFLLKIGTETQFCDSAFQWKAVYMVLLY